MASSKGKGVELAVGYVSLVAETDSIPKDVEKVLRLAEKQGGASGRRIGKNISGGLSDTLSGGVKDATRALTSGLHGQSPSLRGVGMQMAENLLNPFKGLGGRAADIFKGEFSSKSEKVGHVLGGALGLTIGTGISAGITLGIGTAIAAVTLAAGGIGYGLVKGFQRLKNIDAATFKLKALGHSAAEAKQIMDSALKSVQGTAFSLDESAEAAAAAVAAGIKPGKELTQYLTDIADGAAIAGIGFAEMASIFNKVQTKGKAMTEDLNQLADRGVPVFQWLAKEYGVTGDALTKMVSKGQVDAEHFRAAIEHNIGGAALNMRGSFDGAVENVQAAFARFGAALIEPFFGDMTNGVNKATAALDKLTAWVQAHQPEIIDFFLGMAETAVSAFGAINQGIADTARLLAPFLSGYAKVMKVLDRIPGIPHSAISGDTVEQWANDIYRVSDALDSTQGTFDKWKTSVTDYKDRLRESAEFTRDIGHAAAEISGRDVTIKIEDNAEEVLGKIDRTKFAIENLPDGKVRIVPLTDDAVREMNAFRAKQGAEPVVVRMDVDINSVLGKLNSAGQNFRQMLAGVAPPPPTAPGAPPQSPVNAHSPILGSWFDYDPRKLPAKADGGAIEGKGPKGTDSVLMWGAPGEHMLDTDDVSALGGQKGVLAFRSALKAGQIPGYDEGGEPGQPPKKPVPGAMSGIDYAAQHAVGQQYEYGGVGNSGGYDCSGIASAIYAASTGRPQGTRYLTTESNFEAMGFIPGYMPGALNIGVRRGGGGPNSHMAVTLPNGVKVESGGASNTTQYGGNAKGAEDFPMHWYLPLGIGGDPAAGTGGTGMSGGSGGGGDSSSMGMPVGITPGAADAAAAGGLGGDGSGRTEGYIPAGAGNTGVPGTSFASGLLNMGAEAVNGIIDQAASAAATAASAAATMGSFGAGGQAGGAAASFAIGLGANAAKRGVSYGFQMAGIGVDSLIEQLTPFGAPRWLGYDYTGFAPQMSNLPAAVTSAEQAAQGASQPQTPAQGVMPAGVAEAPGLEPLPTPGSDPFGTNGGGPVAPGPLSPAEQPAQPQGQQQQQAPQPQQQPPWALPALYDKGGLLPPGGVGVNKLRKPEVVLTPPQWDDIRTAATKAPLEPAVAGGNDYSVRVENVTVKDVNELQRELSSQQRLQMMRYAGRP
ncbi:tape measure protein [Mycobacteroides abscessus]|uniref:tape measure protein n=1 Tax=Mycobacteroides abscessus TaxID=36809 RepID=UPI00189677B3